MLRGVSRNIILLYLIKVCKWFMLYLPVVKLYYLENGLTDSDLFVLHAVYSLVIAFTEIPSGYASDRWGRRPTLIVGLSLGCIGFGVYSFTAGFWTFLLAEILLGVGEGFISGSDTALLYDSLQQQKLQHKYLKHEGNMSSAGNFAEALAGIAVTLLALHTVRNYYYLQTIFSFVALIAGFMLVEPAVHKFKHKVSWQGIIGIVKNTLWKQRLLSRYVLFSSIIGFASLSMAWFAQIFIFEAGVENTNFGIVWTALNLMVALGSVTSVAIYNSLGLRKSLIYILIFISAGIFIASFTINLWGLMLLTIFYFVRGTAHPILKDQINHLTPSEIRATVLSVRSLLIRLLFSAFAPLFGWMTDKISLSTALLFFGILVFIPGFILTMAILKYNSTKA